jgi:hypothetical protein
MENRFIHVKLDAALLTRAKQSSKIKEERGRLCNLHHRPMTGRRDAFWTGSVGEAVAEKFLRESNDSGYPIITPDDPTCLEKADILANTQRVDVKTRKGFGGVRTRYTMFVEPESAYRADYFIFCWYDKGDESATLLGYLDREQLLSRAQRVAKGQELENRWKCPNDAFAVRVDQLSNIMELPSLLRYGISDTCMSGGDVKAVV